MQHSPAKTTVIIPNWNGRNLLPQCLDSLFKQEYTDFSVILVDNGSADDSIPFVRSNYPQVKIIQFSENRGFAAAVNEGIRSTDTEYIALLNTDTWLRKDWLSNLAGVMDSCDPGIGCLASKMLDMANPSLIDNAGDFLSWQGGAFKRGRGEAAEKYSRIENVFSACAGAALYRKSFLEKLGGFDEVFFAYLEDVDLGLRARHMGYQCVFVPQAEILHKGHGSGMRHSRYVRLMTRNRLLVFIKNIPSKLLIKHFLSIIYGQFYFMILYRRPLDSLMGYFSFFKNLPHALRQRKMILQSSKLPVKTLDSLLTQEMPEPSLIQSIVKRLKGLSS